MRTVAESESDGGSFAAAAQHIAPFLQEVERLLRDEFGGASKTLTSVALPLIEAGGKRLRPALLFFGSALCGYRGEAHVRVAAALEFLHTATLIHDDVIDLAETRRGAPAARVAWGNTRAVLAGDFMFSRAYRLVAEAGDPQLSVLFGNLIGELCDGETLEIEATFDADVTEARYYEVIEKKTAAFVRAVCEMAAVLAGATGSERARLAEFGRELGIAFQLRDDALDFEGDATLLGKAVCTDLVEGKLTLPLLLTLERASGAERQSLRGLIREAWRPTESSQALAEVLERVRGGDGIEETLRRADAHVAAALEAITPFEDGWAKQALAWAAHYVVRRQI